MINYQKAIGEGLGLEIVNRLSREHHTYHVKSQEGAEFVVKLSPRDRTVSYYRDLAAESQMLDALSGPITLYDPRLSPLADFTPCVPKSHGLRYGLTELLILPPHQIRRKSQASFLVLFREYLDGRRLEENELLEPSQTTSLRNTVYAVQKAGFCRLDLSSRNILIQDQTNLPFLLDLSQALPKSGLEGATFEELCVEDLEAIDFIGQG